MCTTFQSNAYYSSVTGILKAADKKHKGKFEIPNLSEENDADEINVSINDYKDFKYLKTEHSMFSVVINSSSNKMFLLFPYFEAVQA